MGDRRAADASIRYFGLGRMPETLESIAATLRSSDRTVGLTIRQVQNLIGSAVDSIAAHQPEFASRRGRLDPGPPADPFPIPVFGAASRELRKVLLWAWADVADPPCPSSRALLYYEQEHGLRQPLITPSSRMEGQRWRRLAWSMIGVARYRLSEADPADPLVDRSVGPRSVAVVEEIGGDGVDALLLLQLNPALGDFRYAASVVGQAVRVGRADAPELLGMLRDAVVRARSVPIEVRSKVLALSVIIAREHRDPGGGPAAVELLNLAQGVLREKRAGKLGSVGSIVASDALRATQELAQLQHSLGEHLLAWRTLRAMRGALESFGDPEQEVEPDGWLQQWLVTKASLERRIARYAKKPVVWLKAAGADADRSADVALSTGVLPESWGLAARSQRLAVTLDMAEAAINQSDLGEARRLIAIGRSRLNELEASWMSLPGGLGPTADGLLVSARAAWRLALLEGDREATVHARSEAWGRVRVSTKPAEVEKLRVLDVASECIGLERYEPPFTTQIVRANKYDRGDLRPTTTAPKLDWSAKRI